jgi:hypothetical protein
MSPFEFQLRIFLLMPQVKVKNSDTRCFIRSLTKNVRSLGTFFCKFGAQFGCVKCMAHYVGIMFLCDAMTSTRQQTSNYGINFGHLTCNK